MIAVRRRAGEHADRAVEALRVVAGVLDRFPCGLHEKTLLRIEDLGFLRREAEELLVELVRAGEDAAGAHVVRARARKHVLAPRGLELLGREARDALAPREQVLPQRSDVRRFGKTPGHADDGDAIERIVGVGVGHGVQRLPVRLRWRA